MTNKEWLDHLAHNAPDELADWFDAEHVEHQDSTLDGDTEPENADSRERLEAEIESYSAFDMMDTITLDMVIGWLDRQAAITEEQTRCKWVTASADEIATWRSKAEKLQAKVDELTQVAESKRLSFADRIRFVNEIDELTAERDKLQELNEYHALQYELASEDADRLQAQVYKLTAERDNWKANCKDWKKDCERYREKFGKCIDYADAIHDLMDEGMA